jgi:HSP20 family protein
MFGLVPFDFDGMMRSMDKLFRDYSMQDMRMDVEDLGDKYEMTVELPGMKKEDISLRVKDNILTIKASHASESQNSPDEESRETALTDRNFIHQERSYRSMERSFNVEGVLVDQIRARYEDGLLIVDLPKESPTAQDNTYEVNID